VTVPYGTAAGTYTGSVEIVADGNATTFPVAVGVAPVTLPRQNQVSGSLLTAFNFSPQSYGAKVSQLYGVAPQDSLSELFSFFAYYRLSPNNWGYGNPRVSAGYTSARQWWLDKSSQMVSAAGEPGQFASMWIPVSNNRWSPSTYVGNVSPFKPQRWCSYLRSVHGFWQQARLARLVPVSVGDGRARADALQDRCQQAKAVHSCFGGGHVIVTGGRPPRTASSGTAARTTWTTGSCWPAATTASTRTRPSRGAASRTRRRTCA
jgi:hypothetical protein